MKTPLIMFSSIALLGIGTTHGDTLALIQDAANKGEEAAVPEATEKSNWYATAAIGGNIMLDSDFKDDSNATLKYKAGVGSAFGFGYQFNKSWSLEFQTGVNWNGVDELTWSTPVAGVGVANITGGSGDIYQVPVIANATWSIALTDKISLGLSAGLGVQWNNVNIHGVQASAVGFGNLGTAEFSQSSFAFRYQAGIQIAHQVTHNIHMGFGVRFSGTSEINLGTGTFYPTAGGALQVSNDDLKLTRFMNFSLGGGIKITF